MVGWLSDILLRWKRVKKGGGGGGGTQDESDLIAGLSRLKMGSICTLSKRYSRYIETSQTLTVVE